MATQISSNRLRATRLFAAANEQTLQVLAATSTQRELRNAERLWSEGASADHMFLVEYGMVEVRREAPSGVVEVLGLFGPNDVVAVTAALSESVYPASGVAAAPSVVVIRIPSRAFREAVARDIALSKALLDTLLVHTGTLRAKISFASAGSITARVALLLLHLAERFGKKAHDGRTRLSVLVSRTTMAGLVSARAETVSRVLGGFRAKGFVTSIGGTLEVDEGALRTVAAAG